MVITIHRGSHEIGGTCIEVADETTRIIVDIGLPLWASSIPKNSAVRKSIRELIADRILPDVPGLYTGDKNGRRVDAILLSHPHLDHHGILRYVRNDIPIYTGAVSAQLIELTASFSGQPFTVHPSFVPIISNQSFRLGGFSVTPYLMDHSAFDSYAFLIQDSQGKPCFTPAISGTMAEKDAHLNGSCTMALKMSMHC